METRHPQFRNIDLISNDADTFEQAFNQLRRSMWRKIEIWSSVLSQLQIEKNDPEYFLRMPAINRYKKMTTDKYTNMLRYKDAHYGDTDNERTALLIQLVDDVEELERSLRIGYAVGETKYLELLSCDVAKQCLRDSPTTLMRKIMLLELHAVHQRRFGEANERELTIKDFAPCPKCRKEIKKRARNEKKGKMAPLKQARTFLAYCAILDSLCFSRLPRMMCVLGSKLTSTQLQRLVEFF